jgi:hypothetical protein
MIIDGQQQGLLFTGWPPLVDGGIVLPQFIDAGAFPAPAGSWTRFGLADEIGKMGSGEGGHRFAMTLETEAGFQFVRHQLEIGRFVEGEEFLEEGEDFGRPVGPMVAAGEFGAEGGGFREEAGAQPVKMGATDLEMVGAISGINRSCVELSQDLLEKQVGEAIGELIF